MSILSQADHATAAPPRRWRRLALLAAALVPVGILAAVLLPRHASVVVTNAFARGPDDWAPGPVAFAPRPFTFQPDGIRPPTPEQWARWRAAYPLVRPMPYPYFAGLSVPTDCCSSYLSDVYYFANLLSRRFGLDFPSSFWVYSVQPNAIAAFYLSDPTRPAHGRVELEGDAVDRVSLLLMAYYRGWLDHLHQWSDESGSFGSLVQPCTATVGPAGIVTVDLQVEAVADHAFLGLELSVAPSATVQALELELIDAAGQAHWVVHGQGLAGRPGWDLSALPRVALRQAYIHLGAEANAVAAACLGQAGKPHLQAGRLTVRGDPGATVQIQMVRPFDLTRACVADQLATLRALNVAPICSTNHGGNSSWTQLDHWNPPNKQRDPLTGQVFQLARPGLGATPGAPAYCADLLDDFGIAFHSQTARYLSDQPETLVGARALLGVWTRRDGRKMYVCPRGGFAPTPAYPDVTTGGFDQFENLGGNLVRCLDRYDDFGQLRVIYTHHNFYNPDTFAPPSTSPRSLSEVRRLHPYLEQALEMLACLKYNLDGQRAAHQRIWCAPLSVALRFAQTQRALAAHCRLQDNDIHITPWTDEVTGHALPELAHLSQDLHGQTFYVPEAASARVFCGGLEITSLRRNPPDGTGRPSVSIVDTETPTVLFDEVPLDEAGPVRLHNAAVRYPDTGAAVGQRCLEVRSIGGGDAALDWQPRRLDNHETDFIHLRYRKSNPASVASFRWTDAAGQHYVVTEGQLGERHGWEIGPHAGPGYREVVLEYADRQAPAGSARRIPRGAIRQVRFALAGAQAGDTVHFDRVAFLSARGLRVEAGSGLVLGGRLSSRQDGIAVEACVGAQTWQAVTEHGGWYILRGIPREQVVEISATVNGRRCHPERGRLVQAVRNDLEYDIDVAGQWRSGGR